MDAQSHLSRLRGPRTPLTVPACMLAHIAQADARAQEVEYLVNCLAPYESQRA